MEVVYEGETQFAKVVQQDLDDFQTPSQATRNVPTASRSGSRLLDVGTAVGNVAGGRRRDMASASIADRKINWGRC